MEQFVTQTLDWLLPYIAEKGVYFGGAAAFLFYLVQTYSNWNRAGEQTILQKFFSLVLLVAAAGSTGFAFQTFSANYLPKSDAQKASERIAGAFDRCIARTAALDAVVKSGIESRGGHPIDLQCLAFAFQQFQPREASIEEAELLFNDMQLGYKLLHPDADAPRIGAAVGAPKTSPVGDTLYKYFGIITDSYLGTGYSLPGPVAGQTSRYSDATLREFLVPNRCAETFDKSECPERDPTTWAWTLPIDAMNRPVRDLLSSLPKEGRDEYAAHRSEILSPASDGVFIRFQKFQEKNYTGRVGRPIAAYVFFSDLQGALGLTLREAFHRSGQTDPEADVGKPGQKIFVWVTVAEGGHFDRLATWRNVFVLLNDIAKSVDPALKAAATAPPKP